MIDDQTIRDLCRLIVQDFQPDKIILFGSYASGQSTPDS
ncbi:MAG: nucleotidyltransferase domain-containing protein, partial [Deltaproteobacteria bacterium]|nr:nucleotidyltransferase domain-containing protein [Deltaproteobacteria bacterium]